MRRSINETTKETTGGFVDVSGINDNWVLDSYKFAPLSKDGSGSPVLQFGFKNGGMSVRLTEWDINPATVKEKNQKNVNSKISDDKAVQKEYNAQDGRITQILRCFVPKEEVIIETEGYADYSKAIIAILDKAKNKTQLLRMKTIYGTSGYLEFSTKNGRFIQLAKDPINDMRLTNWEKEQIVKNKKDSTPNTDAQVATSTTIVGGEF